MPNWPRSRRAVVPENFRREGQVDHLEPGAPELVGNREAAEALHEFRPHAVTDVTGFGLAGHVAEMAEASGTAVEIDLGALPLLPGALKAAATGLEVDEDADELRVDLCLDPQTSGGLLASLSPENAEALVRRLPGSAIVGRVTDGSAGTVRLVASRGAAIDD